MKTVKNLFKLTVKSVSRATLGLLALTMVNAAVASESGVVISQIYGGNGTTFNRDYVELFNAANVPVNISGWSVQYSSSTGTGLFSGNGITALNGTLQPGQYYLVGLNTAAAGTALPNVDASGTTNLSGVNGKLVMVNNSAGLACNGGSAPCNATQTAQIVDLVGYGNANYFESAVAPTLSSTTALYRAGNGCSDSNNNSTDFAFSAPAPRNSGSPLAPCGSGPINQPIVTSCPALNVTIGNAATAVLSASDADGIVNGVVQTSAEIWVKY